MLHIHNDSWPQFDPNTGQVFTEYTVTGPQAGARSHAAWVFQEDEARPAPSRGRGVSSLLDLALRSVALKIDFLAREHFEFLPSKVLSRIWTELEKSRGLSFHAWKILSSLRLLKQDDNTTMGLYRFAQRIDQPGPDLKCYTQPLTSLSLDFITHIMLTDTYRLRTAQLLCLANVKNLGVLEIMHPTMSLDVGEGQVSDRLIRGWTEMDKPFPVLRVLKIFGRSQVSRDAIAMVSKFPSLAVFDVQGERGYWTATDRWAHASGWSASQVRRGESGYDIRELLRSAEESAEKAAVDRQTIVVTARGSVFPFHEVYKAPYARIRLSPEDQAVPKPSVNWNRVYPNDGFDPNHGYPFGSFAFWTYAMIGQLQSDEDLRHAGVQLDRQARIGSLPLPCKPMASLRLGGLSKHKEILPRDMGHWVFTRLSHHGERRELSTPLKRAREGQSAESRASVKRTKQADMGNMLRRF